MSTSKLVIMGEPLQRSVVRWMYIPLILCAVVVGIGVLGARSESWIPVMVVSVLLFTFVAEAVAPFADGWRVRDHAFPADVVSAVINESVVALGVMAAPMLAGWLSLEVWPADAPRLPRIVAGALILDAGVTLAHWWSHRSGWLWRFHAIHHGAERLYGLNGLMKHPVHLVFETTVGIAPLIVLGIDRQTATALAGLVAVQLVVQHANVGYRVGWFGTWFAWNGGHRLHHVADETEGNVNFGLFTLIWDRMLGTYRRPGTAELPPSVGLPGATMPPRYRDQLAMPWTRTERAHTS